VYDSERAKNFTFTYVAIKDHILSGLC